VLTQVADGVLVHESEFCQSNAIVVQGRDGVLLIDPGVHAAELECLANDLAAAGHTVVAGFSTHPHWDHLLWHDRFGTPPRLATALGATTVRERLSNGIDAQRFGIPDDVPLDLLGQVTGVPADAGRLPWDGPEIRIVEHHAHAPGHAALVIDDLGVLVAGDMLSDVLVPMLDVHGSADPVADYLGALALLEPVVGGVSVVIPGHGSVAGAEQARARITTDRAYVEAVRDGREVSDPRIGESATPGWEWVSDVHAGQLQRLAARGEHS
jgi:glyoxylase-like metal-dependent hydrolase (beta-lactamase superfamily II)